MAGSRLEKIGTIFWRVTGLMRSGVLKEDDKPIWYNVYKAFPPKHEPRYDRPVSTKEIPNIFYPEDIVRAKFYKAYGSPGLFDMTNNRNASISQRFVDRFAELQEQDPKSSNDTIFQAVEDSLVAEGVHLVRQKNVHPITTIDRKLLHKPIPVQNLIETDTKKSGV